GLFMLMGLLIAICADSDDTRHTAFGSKAHCRFAPHISASAHFTHAMPPPPQAAAVMPCWQTSPSQQPAQLFAEHKDMAMSGPRLMSGVGSGSGPLPTVPQPAATATLSTTQSGTARFAYVVLLVIIVTS